MPNLNIRVKEGYLEKVDEAAARYNMNRTEFVLKAIDILANFDETFFKKIQQLSNTLNLPEWVVIQNIILDEMAKEVAELAVWDRTSKNFGKFMWIEDKAGSRIMTGSEYFDNRIKQYIWEEEKRKVEVLLRREYYGIPISDEDKALLIKHRAGKTWLESEEYKKEMETQAEVERFMQENNIQEGPKE